MYKFAMNTDWRARVAPGEVPAVLEHRNIVAYLGRAVDNDLEGVVRGNVKRIVSTALEGA